MSWEVSNFQERSAYRVHLVDRDQRRDGGVHANGVQPHEVAAVPDLGAHVHGVQHDVETVFLRRTIAQAVTMAGGGLVDPDGFEGLGRQGPQDVLLMAMARVSRPETADAEREVNQGLGTHVVDARRHRGTRITADTVQHISHFVRI